MDPQQRRVVVAIGALVGVVALVVAIVALTGGDDEQETATATSTSSSTTSTSTTTTARATTTTAGRATTTTRPPATTARPPAGADSLVLEGDGVGLFDFGTETETLVNRLNALLGPPAEDTGFRPGSSSQFGVCPGQVRGVRWGSLWVLFTDGRSEFGPAGRGHFFAYIDTPFSFDGDPVDSLGLATAEDVGLGSTVAELKAAYGDRVEVEDEAIFGPTFVVRVQAGSLGGDLTGTADDETVTAVRGGSGCGE